MGAGAREQTPSSHCSPTQRQTHREASWLQMFLRALSSSGGPHPQTPSQGGRVESQQMHFGGCILSLCLPRCLSGEESACNAGTTGDTGLIPGAGRSSGGGNGNPLQCSYLENTRTEEPGGLQSMVPHSQTLLSTSFCLWFLL